MRVSYAACYAGLTVVTRQPGAGNITKVCGAERNGSILALTYVTRRRAQPNADEHDASPRDINK